MKIFKKIIYPILFFCSISASISVQAQSKKTYVKGQAATLKRLRTAVERDPNNLKLNQKLIYAWGWGEKDSTIITQYNYWLKRFPKSSVMPFAIGQALGRMNRSPKAAKFLYKALSLNPNLADAWYLLSADAEIKGDSLKMCEYLDKAVKLNPKNPEYAFTYAMQFRYSDPLLYQSLALDILKRFPKSEWGTIAISWLIDIEKDETKKITYYELLKDSYIKNRGFWYYTAMEDYFKHMLIINPNKSLEIAQLQNLRPNIELAETMIKVKELLTTQKNEMADTLVQHAQIYGADTPESLLLFKAQVADAAHHTQKAFDSLIHYYSKRPGANTVQKIMFGYGLKLELTNAEIENKIKILQDSAAKQAIDFSLNGYLINKKYSLTDFKGKVILLTYWIPGTFNCRTEFPHFEKVLQKFNKNDIAYLAINVEPQQDDYVLPLLKHNGYRFLPLRDSLDNRKSNIEFGINNSFPMNYLIDQQGCIVFSGFLIDEYNENMLETMISELLENNNIPIPTVSTNSIKMK